MPYNCICIYALYHKLLFAWFNAFVCQAWPAPVGLIWFNCCKCEIKRNQKAFKLPQLAFVAHLHYIQTPGGSIRIRIASLNRNLNVVLRKYIHIRLCKVCLLKTISFLPPISQTFDAVLPRTLPHIHTHTHTGMVHEYFPFRTGNRFSCFWQNAQKSPKKWEKVRTKQKVNQLCCSSVFFLPLLNFIFVLLPHSYALCIFVCVCVCFSVSPTYT